METHGHNNKMVKGTRSMDSMEQVVCSIAACKFACRNAHCWNPVCDVWRRLDRLGSEPTRPASEALPPAQQRQAKCNDCVAVDKGVH